MKITMTLRFLGLPIFTILALSLLPAVAQQFGCVPPPAGIVGWWPAEGNAVDVITATAGTLYPGTAFTNGVVGEALSFDGTNGCVMNDDTPPYTNIQNNFTMEFWAYPQKGFNILPENGGTNQGGMTGQSYAIFPNWTDDDGAGAGVSVGTNGISVLTHAVNFLPSILSYPKAINGWVHIAVVFTNKQPVLYVNGVYVHTGVTSPRAYVFPSKNLGSCYEPGFSFQYYGPYQGLLDEVSIYNRALTAGEIQSIYTAGSAGKCFEGIAPAITNAPAAQSILLGGTVTFSVAASGPPPLSYQWSFDGTNLVDATNDVLTLTNLAASDAGVYTVEVTNPYGSATNSSAVLTVLQPPYILSQPVDLTVIPPSPATFSVVAGGPNLSYQWQFNNRNIKGETSATYTLPSVAVGDGGNFRVIISNSYGTVTSSNATLNVVAPAFATAVVQDGFVVSYLVTTGGFGYTNVPSVKIVNGGGSGAKAEAVVSNGIVVGITILDAGIDYTNTPLVIIEPPIIPNAVLAAGPMTLLSYSGLAPGGGTNGSTYQLQKAQGWYWTNLPPVVATSNGVYIQFATGNVASNAYQLALQPLATQAFASAVVSHGFIIAANLTSGGSGYTSSPPIQIVGGGGAEATAISAISTNGSVTNIVITSAGIGYTSAPAVEIGRPPATAIVPVAWRGATVSATNLLAYENYQLEIASAPNTAWRNWTNGLFTPTNAASDVQFVFITNPVSFFRLEYVH